MIGGAPSGPQSGKWLRRLFWPRSVSLHTGAAGGAGGGRRLEHAAESESKSNATRRPDSIGDSPSLSARQSDSRPRRARLPLRHMSAVAHAERLLQWLQEPGGLTGRILADELRLIHAEMCAELGWRVRPWQTIARQLALRLSDGKKTWCWIEGPNGERLRRRVYVIPATIEPPQPLPAERLAA